MSAYLGAGIARAAANVQQYQREAPERKLRLQEAENRAELSQMELENYKANQPVREAQRSDELARLESNTYNTQATLAKQQTFDAFRMYGADGDTRHLNNWLQSTRNNPVAAKTTQGMVRFDTPTRSKDIDQLLRKQGITDLDGFYDNPDVSKNFVVGTTADGAKSLIDMNRMYTVTGYAQYTTDEDRKKMALNAQLMQQLRSGGNLKDIQETDAIVSQLAKTMDLPRDEVYKMIREEAEPSKGRPTSPLERIAADLRETNPDLSYRDSLVQAQELISPGRGSRPTSQLERIAAELRETNKDLSYRDSLAQAQELIRPGREVRPTNEAAFIEQYMSDNPEASYEDALAAYREAGKDFRTAKQKDTEYGEEAKVGLDEMFGGDFLDADLSNLTNKQIGEMSNYVNRLEQVGGLELSNEDKKNARAIRKLRSVMTSAGEGLTDEQTGPIDSMLRSVKSYISNNVEGKDATVAYESFRAIARNALFGSQVSGADYKAFNSAFATLGQQTGPVLVSLRTQLQMMQDDLIAMSELNDPYVTKARFGMSMDELDNTVNALQDRIDIINNIANGRPVEGIIIPAKGEGSGIEVSITPKAEAAPAGGERPSLDSIFGGQ